MFQPPGTFLHHITIFALLLSVSTVALYVTGGATAKPIQLARAELRPIVPAFRPGIATRAEIATHQDIRPRLAVPIQAVQNTDGAHEGDDQGTAVFVLAEGKAVRRRVETGVSDDDYIEVSKGLAVAEYVVVGPIATLRRLRDGDLVEAGMVVASPFEASPP